MDESVEVAKQLATDVTTTRLLVVHDAARRGDHQVAKLTRGEHVADPLVKAVDGDVEAGRDDTALVDAAEQRHDDLAAAVVVDNLELTDVAVLLHDLQEAQDHLARRADEHLTLAHLLRVEHVLQRISKDRAANHLRLVN